MLTPHIHTLTLVWQESLLGGAVILACVGGGWWLARDRHTLAARLVAWWLEHIVRPLLASRSWPRRTLIIAANNSFACILVVALGACGSLAWLGVAGIGLGLGIALRLMLDDRLLAPPEPFDTAADTPRSASPSTIITGVGFALNLLEVPAIFLTAGLALSQGAVSSTLSFAAAFSAFFVLLAPTLLIAAGGEALWMSVESIPLPAALAEASPNHGRPTPPPRRPRKPLRVRLLLWLGHAHRRLLCFYFAIIGPRAAYALTGILARCLYRILPPIQLQSEAQCRAALGDRAPAADIPRIARQSFVHRIWNLTDLPLAERLLHPNTYHRYGGRIPEPFLHELRAAQQRRQPAILLTAYYGPFDLLPIFLGYNGIRAGVVYLPHENRQFDAYRRRIRQRSGCETIPTDRAADRLPAILAQGGTVAIVADHHVERRGIPATFLGLPTQAPRSIPLLAWRFDADVIVAGIRRKRCAFQFEIVVSDVLYHAEWSRTDDPVLFITERYLRALEQIILADPTQYLWAHPRWGVEWSRRLLQDASPDSHTSASHNRSDANKTENAAER